MEEVRCLGSGLSPEEEKLYAPDGEKAAEELVRAAAWNGDYNPPAVWRPIQNRNWTPANRPHDYPIEFVVIHYTQGMGFGPIPFGPGGSAHYGFNLDGRADQYIGEAYIAWHAGNWYVNCRSIGIEHVGYGRPQDWTEAMLRASAKLTARLCRKYGIPADREHIIGHSEVRGATHTDPGAHFPWARYMQLVRGYLGKDDSPGPKVLHRVQTGAFSRKDNAERLAAELEKRGYETYIVEEDGLHKVQLGAFAERPNASRLVARLKGQGYDAFVVTK